MLLASLCQVASRLLVLWHVTVIVPYHVKSSDGIRAIFRLDNRFMELVKPVSEFTFQLETDQLGLSAVLVPSIVAVTQDYIHKLYLLENVRTGKTVDKPSACNINMICFKGEFWKRRLLDYTRIEICSFNSLCCVHQDDNDSPLAANKPQSVTWSWKMLRDSTCIITEWFKLTSRIVWCFSFFYPHRHRNKRY